MVRKGGHGEGLGCMATGLGQPPERAGAVVAATVMTSCTGCGLMALWSDDETATSPLGMHRSSGINFR
mgnify:CR=1 FL=1